MGCGTKALIRINPRRRWLTRLGLDLADVWMGLASAACCGDGSIKEGTKMIRAAW